MNKEPSPSDPAGSPEAPTEPGRTHSPWLAYGLPVLLAMVLAAPFLQSSPLAGRSEYRRAMVAKTMAESGDWVVPRFEGEIYLKKPPLHPWLTAASISLTGDHTSEWLLRFPSLLGLLLFAFGSAWLGSRLWRDDRWAALTGVLAATTFLALRETLVVELDIIFAGLTVAGSAALLRAVQAEGTWRRWVLLGQMLVGLGLLTKGPLALLFGWLPPLAWAIHQKRSWGRLLWPPALLLLLLPIAAWIALLLNAVGKDTVIAVWRGETVGRMTGKHVSSTHHVRPWWYYLTRLPAVALPGLLLAAVLPDRWPGWWRRPVVRQTLLWTALVVFAISFIPSKRTAYLTPLVPWLAVALTPLGWHLLTGEAGAWTRWARRGLGVLLAVAIPAAVAAVVIAAVWEPAVWLAAVAICGAAVVTLLLATRWRSGRWSEKPLRHRALAGLTVLIVTGSIIAGVVKPLRLGTTPTHDLLIAVSEATSTGERLGSCGADHEAFRFHLGRSFEQLPKEKAAVIGFLDRPGTQHLLIELDDREDLGGLDEMHEIHRCENFEGEGTVYLMREKE